MTTATAEPRPADSSISNNINTITTTPGLLKVIRRNGTVTPFDANKIAIAITKAFLAVEGITAAGSPRINEMVIVLGQQISDTFNRRMPTGGIIHIEDIQDQVELVLMRTGEHKVARAYVLYREERRKIREEKPKILRKLKCTSL
jgi:ribonucleoside-diphosphate reductase alpha chain